MISVGFHEDIAEAEYLADPCDRPSLSSSIAHLLVSKSPFHAWRAHPRLGNAKEESTEALDRGSIVHALVLGHGARFAVLDVDDYRTKAAREQRDRAIVGGQIPVKRDFYAECHGIALAVTSRLATLGISLAPASHRKTELVAVWEESGVLCRGRLDCLDMTTGATIYDLKTTRDGSDDEIVRSFRRYGYHVQAAAYVSAVETLCPQLAGRVRFVPIFVEADTHEVIPVELGANVLELGRRRWSRAVDAWGRCLTANKWPGYAPAEPRTIEFSDYTMTADGVDALALRERMRAL